MEEVATYYQSEAAAEKEPKSFNDFLYDNEKDGGALNKFAEINSKIVEVKSAIEELNEKYKKMVGDYEYFTNLEDQMNSIINSMNQRAENVAKYFENIVTTCKQVIEEHVKTDANLIDDLEFIDGMLAAGVGTDAGFRDSAKGGNVPYPNIDSIPGLSEEDKAKMRQANEDYLSQQNDAAFRASHNGLSEKEFNALNDIQKQEVMKEANKQQDVIYAQKEEATSNTYANMNKGDYEAIADEIIRTGNYGNGNDRRAELEAQGYNYQDIQDIVNAKMNGTWQGSASATTGGTQVSLAEDPVSGTPSNTKGYEKENAAAEAGFANSGSSSYATDIAQERGKAQTDYYKKQQAQSAVNQAQERGKAQTEHYAEQAAAVAQQNKAAQEQKAKDISPGYSTVMPQTARMNEGTNLTQAQKDAITAGVQGKLEENRMVQEQKSNAIAGAYSTTPPVAPRTNEASGLSQAQRDAITAGVQRQLEQNQRSQKGNVNSVAAYPGTTSQGILYGEDKLNSVVNNTDDYLQKQAEGYKAELEALDNALGTHTIPNNTNMMDR